MATASPPPGNNDAHNRSGTGILEHSLPPSLAGTTGGPLQSLQAPITASLGANQSSATPQYFFLSVVGQIESAEDFVDCSDLFCKYTFVHGQDWHVTMGVEEGISQVALKNPSTNEWSFNFNFPLEIAFKSTNPYGWPRIVIALYGRDGFGSDVVRGYAMGHVPLPGPQGHQNRIRLPCFTPESSSPIQRFLGLIQSRRPEYHDPTMLARADPAGHQARMVTRTSSQGWLTLRLSSVVKDFRKMGYAFSSARSQQESQH